MDPASLLVGRGDARRELTAAFDRAVAGRGAFVVVTGEAGIGKTRLVEAATEDRTTYWARATEGGTAGLGLWHQVFRAARRSGRDLEFEPTTPTGPMSFGVGESGHERFLRIDRALETLHGLADTGFCVVALDDLQWADADSVALLRLLEAELAHLPMVVVATVRSGEAVSLPDGHATIALPGLPSEAIGSIIASVAGVAPSPSVIEAARELSGGNPLFVGEVARLLHGSGSLLDASAWQGVLPSGVHTVLARRLARLPAGSFDVVTAAAVVGIDVDATILAAVTEVERPDLYDLIQPAVDAALVRDLGDGRFRFGHALLHEAALAEVPLRRRQHLHSRAAATLEVIDGERAARAIALHHRAAGERGPAARWARIAGDRALADATPDDAAHLYALARDMGDDSPELALRLAEARSRTGALDDARSLFLEVAAGARRSGDAELFGRAALGVGAIGGGFEVRLLDVSQIALLREALDRIGTEPSADRVRLLARLSIAGAFTTDHDERTTLARRAVDEARGLGDERALVHALAAWSDAHPGPTHIDERVQVSAEMVAAATRVGDPELELLGRRYRIVALMETGNVTVATAEIRAFAQLADTLRQPGFRWYARVAEGMLALLRGDLDAAWDLAAQALADGRAARSANAEMLAAGSLQAMILRERGDIDAFLATITSANAEHHEANRGMDFLYPMFLVGYGVDPDAVREVLARLPHDLGWAANDGLHLFIWSSIGDSAACAGHTEWAERAFAELLPYPDRFALDGTASVCYGPVAATLGRVAAMLGRPAEAADWFRRALTGLSGTPAPLLRARIEAELAACTPAPGDRPTTRRPDLAASTDIGSEPRFARDGATWALAFAGTSARVKDSKGLQDLARLLARPDHEIHVLDLVGAIEGHRPGERAVNADLGPAVDARARREYEQRIRDLTEQVEEAELRNDIAAAAALDDERGQLLEQLGSALGLTGRSRPQGSDAERARKAVGMRIRDAIARIDRELPALGAHLRNSVHTGVFCSYRPEQPIGWHLD